MLGGLTPMKNLRSLVGDEGTTFTNAFVHTPICCPSRSSYLSGRYLHNGGAINNSVAGNCYGSDWQSDAEADSFAVHAKQAGYTTSYTGKYLNAYSLKGSPGCPTIKAPGCLRVPPGWDYWAGLRGNSRYYNETVIVSDDGGKTARAIEHGDDFEKDYYPDVVANRTLQVLDEILSEPAADRKPFLVVNAWPTPHGPFTPPPWADHIYDGYQAPRTPNWNASEEVMQQKQWLMRQQAPIDDQIAQNIDKTFEMRWEALVDVDDHIKAFIERIEAAGELDNTYVIFASDHGFQLGQERLPGDKRHLYENDVRIPFLVRGPGVAKNATQDAIVLNVDVAPTIAQIAGGGGSAPLPANMDGRSILRFLGDDTPVDEVAGNDAWRTDFLVSYHGQYQHCGLQTCPPPPPDRFHENDGKNNTYHCVRTMVPASTDAQAPGVAPNSMYCKFVDSENFVEYYDIDNNPWQLANDAKSLSPADHAAIEARLAAFMSCKGAGCRSL